VKEEGEQTAPALKDQAPKALSAAERISVEGELKRIELKLAEVRGRVGRDAMGSCHYSKGQREELEKLKARKRDLLNRLGCEY
jgi:hypothetical protein